MDDFKLLDESVPLLRKLDWDFFNFCKDYYDAICILMRDDTCKESTERGLPICSAFGTPNKKTDGRHNDSWPAIWRAKDKFLPHVHSCGNSHQFQVGNECGLVQIAYVKKNGKWYYKFGEKSVEIIDYLEREPFMENAVIYVPKELESEELLSFLKEFNFYHIRVFGDQPWDSLHNLQCTHLCICPTKKSWIYTKGTFGNPELTDKEFMKKIGGHLHGEKFGL